MKQLSILSLVMACAALAACNRPAEVTTQSDAPAMAQAAPNPMGPASDTVAVGQSGAMRAETGAASAPAN